MRCLRILPPLYAISSCPLSRITRKRESGRTSSTRPRISINSSLAIVISPQWFAGSGRGRRDDPGRAARWLSRHRWKGPWALLRAWRSGERADVGGLRALGTLDHVELNARVLGERLVAAGVLDVAEVGEQVLAAGIRRDEAVALGFVEPLHDSGLVSHIDSFDESWFRAALCHAVRTPRNHRGRFDNDSPGTGSWEENNLEMQTLVERQPFDDSAFPHSALVAWAVREQQCLPVWLIGR